MILDAKGLIEIIEKFTRMIVTKVFEDNFGDCKLEYCKLHRSISFH